MTKNQRKSAKSATSVCHFLILLLVAISFTSCSQQDSTTGEGQSNSIAQEVSANLEKRESITFIMGEDDEPGNLYYSNAKGYYQNHPEEKTDYLVTSCFTLLDVRNYLDKNPPQNGLPWGTVNIVVHANEWTGIGVPIAPNEKKKASPQVINWAVETGVFLPLKDELVDASTRIVIQGCASGKNSDLMKAVKIAFGDNDDQQPQVISPHYFISYESTIDGSGARSFQKYLVDYWYVSYPAGKRLGDIRLSRKFQERYPDLEKDWRDALSREAPRFPGDLYYYTFDIPVVWYVTYPDKSSRPTVSGEEQQLFWVAEQEALRDEIERLGFVPKDFTWTIRPTTYTFDDGVTEPAIKAIGLCTILCALEAIMEETS